MAPELRRVDDDSYPAFVNKLKRTYGFDFNPDEDTFRSILDFDRAFGHFEGDAMVSTIGAYSLEMTNRSPPTVLCREESAQRTETDTEQRNQPAGRGASLRVCLPTHPQAAQR